MQHILVHVKVDVAMAKQTYLPTVSPTEQSIPIHLFSLQILLNQYLADTSREKCHYNCEFQSFCRNIGKSIVVHGVKTVFCIVFDTRIDLQKQLISKLFLRECHNELKDASYEKLGIVS